MKNNFQGFFSHLKKIPKLLRFRMLVLSYTNVAVAIIQQANYVRHKHVTRMLQQENSIRKYLIRSGKASGSEALKKGQI